MGLPVKEILEVAKFLKTKEGRELVEAAKKAVPGVNTNGTSADRDSPLENMSQDEKLDKLREVMVGDPRDYAIRGAAAAATGISDFIGNKAVTDSNRLAQAILAANRTHSNKQNDLYGPSRKENVSNIWAQEKLRRGEDIKNITNETSKVIDNLSGLYGQRDDVSRVMQAQELVRAPGSFYNYANSLQRAAQQAKKGGR